MEGNISFICDGGCRSFQLRSIRRLASRVTKATTVALTVLIFDVKGWGGGGGTKENQEGFCCILFNSYAAI